MTTAMKITRVQLFEGIHNTDPLIAALQRKDRSYVKGALQWLERHPPNPYIVVFLKSCLQRLGYG